MGDSQRYIYFTADLYSGAVAGGHALEQPWVMAGFCHVPSHAYRVYFGVYKKGGAPDLSDVSNLVNY